MRHLPILLCPESPWWTLHKVCGRLGRTGTRITRQLASTGPTLLSDTKPFLRPLELSTDRLGLKKCWGPGLFSPTRCKASYWRLETETVSWMGPEMVFSLSLRASWTF